MNLGFNLTDLLNGSQVLQTFHGLHSGGPLMIIM